MKSDTEKYLYELCIKALKLEKELKEIPKSAYYSADSEFFKKLEKRNELLNIAIIVLNKEVGVFISSLRIHQLDARYVYASLKEFFIKTGRKAAVA